jgi:MFS family permease
MSGPIPSRFSIGAASAQAGAKRAAWGAAFACAVGTILSFPPIIVLTLPVLLKPISAEFGWGRATLSGALLVAGITGATISPLAGRAIDRWGARAVVLPGIVAFGLIVMSLALIGSSAAFYAAFALLGVAHVAAGQIPYNKVVSAWFNERRGLALGIAVGAALSIGNGLAPQVARFLSADIGWRQTYGVLGLTILLVGFPVMLAWLREPAGDASAPAAACTHEAIEGVSARRALMTADFWLIIAIVACFWLAISGFRVHVVALFTDRGQSELLASTALSIWSVGAFLGHIVIGYALDRVATPRIAIPFFACTLAGFLLMDHGSGTALTLSGAALIGLGMGAEVTLAPYLASRFFGMRATGEIYAYITICTSIAGSAGPYLMGLSFDAFTSYRTGLNAAAVALAACIVMTALLGPYVYSRRGK